MIKMNGLEGLTKQVEDLQDVKRMEEALGKACALVERSARINAPKDTGALRRSITSEVVMNGQDLEGHIFTPLEYAPYIEYGTGLFAEEGGRQTPWAYEDDEGNWHSTRGQQPQPFMRPALDENREEILKILREALLND